MNSGSILGTSSIHNVQALAKGKVPHRNIERGVPVFSPLFLHTCVYLHSKLDLSMDLYDWITRTALQVSVSVLLMVKAENFVNGDFLL